MSADDRRQLGLQPLGAQNKIIYDLFKSNRKGTPPYSMEAEEGLIGSVVINPYSFNLLRDTIKPDSFFFTRHAYIWRAMERIYERGDDIDPITITSELKDVGKIEETGCPAYLTHLIANTPTSVHARTYAAIIERASARRIMIAMADKITQAAMKTELALGTVLSEIAALYMDAMSVASPKTEQTMTEALNDVLRMVESLYNGETIPFIPTGFRDIDTALDGGIEPGSFSVLLGGEGSGKSLWMIQLALNMARLGRRVLFISTEAEKNDLLMRMIACETNINSQNIRQGKMMPAEYERFTEAAGRLNKLPIVIDYVPYATPAMVEARAYRAMQGGNGLDIILIDGIYDMTDDDQHEQKNVDLEYVSLKVRDLARKLKKAIITSHHTVIKEVAKRKDKRPQTSDSLWSSKVPLSADNVFALYAERKYNPNCQNPNVYEFLFLKRRNGKISGYVPLWFDDNIPMFKDVKMREVHLGK